MKKLWLLLVIALCLPTTVFTETNHFANLPADHPMHLLGDPTGNDYLSVCEAAVTNPYNQPSDHAVACAVWLSGVLNGFNAMAAQNMQSPPWNIPDALTTEQMQKIVVKYMNDHPKDLNKFASLLVLWALKDAYPPGPSPTKK